VKRSVAHKIARKADRKIARKAEQAEERARRQAGAHPLAFAPPEALSIAHTPKVTA